MSERAPRVSHRRGAGRGAPASNGVRGFRPTTSPGLIMRRLAKAIDGLDEPAVEKIARDQQDDPFQVLVATMLSAQTKDAVTAAASERLFRLARTPKTMG